MARLFVFLTNPDLKRSRFGWLLAAGMLLSACAELQITATPPPAQPAPPPVVAPPPPPQPQVETPPPAEPEIAAPAGPIVDILRRPDLVTAGLLLPLTGEASELGRDLLAASQMALFDLADANFELRLYDTGGNTGESQSAALAARQDGVQIILGPLFSSAVLAAADVARPANIPIIAFTNNRDVAGDGVYTMGFFPEDQVKRIVDFSYNQGFTRYSILAPDDLYGSRMVGALNENAFGGGREITDVAFYIDETELLIETVKELGKYEERQKALIEQREELAELDDEISKRALERLEDLETLGDPDFEALLLPAGGEEVLRIAPLLAFYDIDPARIKLLGTWLWDDPSLRTEPSMAGAWFAAPPTATRERFVERFEQLHGRPPDRRATLAYDATALVVVLAQRAARDNQPVTSGYTLNALTEPSGFTGMDGIFRLLPSGLVERGLAVYEIQPGGAFEIDPAPASFEAFVN